MNTDNEQHLIDFKGRRTTVLKVNMTEVQTAFYTLLVLFCQENLQRHQCVTGLSMSDDSYRSKFAVRIEDHRLIVKELEKKTVLSEIECVYKCMKKTRCLSFGMSRQRHPQNLLLCHLLASDHYRHRDRLVERKGFDYFYFQNACSSFACGPRKSCIPDYESNNYRCVCNKQNQQGECQASKNGYVRWVTTSDPDNGNYNYNWTVPSVVVDANVELKHESGSQFIERNQVLDPSTGKVTLLLELAEHPNHYVIGENGNILVRADNNTQAFKQQATFYRNVSTSNPGYEMFIHQGLTVFCNLHAGSELKYKNHSSMTAGDIYWFKFVK